MPLELERDALMALARSSYGRLLNRGGGVIAIGGKPIQSAASDVQPLTRCCSRVLTMSLQQRYDVRAYEGARSTFNIQPTQPTGHALVEP